MKFDIIVIGGGHAGIEAANIAAKKNVKILLITNHLDLIGQMSCNPAIGGIAKGNIVREIDALGGIMGKLIDTTGIHFKMLNKSKGPAVWGNRAQADKVKYRNLARKGLEQHENISFLQGLVKNILVKGNTVYGIEMDSGEKISSSIIIVAAGTFLDGEVFIGLNSFSAGRAGEPAAHFLAQNINDFGIKKGRLKTGTSPRIDARTVNFEELINQPGDEDPWPFSFSTTEKLKNTTVCWIGRTNTNTHQIIQDNLNRSPLYTGKIKSIGPRYCPSIEDKVVRFGERESHTLFLEPESIDNQEMYLNGLSTSLPFDVQIRLVNSIMGLENAKIIRPGYGIEYTYFQPNQLLSTLESKIIKNLYFAGQINGTSGYEEAACQGLIAGINATQRFFGDEEVILGRDTSYTGVLIDDLVSRGTEEPYRMFTSRAEYRLNLRQDNCDERLMPLAFKLGYIDSILFEKQKKRWEKKEKIIDQLKKITITPEKWNNNNNEILKHSVKAIELLKRPENTLDDIINNIKLQIDDEKELKVSIEAEIKYSGFIEKQDIEINKIRHLELEKIPDKFDYNAVCGLLTESLGKMKAIRPQTLGQASRIPGVTPADISILAIYLSKPVKP
jgi:tRNA uridine 5-carboxymethylaminomethyl modification enzyme